MLGPKNDQNRCQNRCFSETVENGVSGGPRDATSTLLETIWDRFGNDLAVILSKFFKINLIEKSTYDIQQTACSNSKSPPKNSKTFHKPPKTTFSFTDRQAAIDDGIVEQTSERLAQKRGGGGRRRRASSITLPPRS